MRTTRAWAVMVTCGLLTGAVACTEEGDTIVQPSGSSGAGAGDGTGGGGTVIPAGKAMLRVVHSSADAPAVDVWSGDVKIATALSYGDTSEWLMVDAGTYDVQIKASPSSATDDAVFEVEGVELEEKMGTTAIAAGLLSSTADASKFRVLPVTENFNPSGTGSAIARVIHASPDAPTVGIDLHDDDASSPELSGIDRFTGTAEEGFPLSAGEALQIGIVAGGARVTAFTTPEPPEGAELLVIATGLVAEPGDDADGFALLAVGPDGSVGFIRQNPIVYALHNSPDAPPVDLYAGEAMLASLSFGELAKPVQVPPGDYPIDFRVQGSDPMSAPAITAQTGALEPGKRYLTMASGLLGGSGDAAFNLASYAENFDRGQPETALIRAIHGSPDAPAVDLGVLNVEGVVNPVLVSNISFRDASAAPGLSVGTGTIPVGVTPAGQNDTVVASFHAPTFAGLRAFGIASGALSPANGESFRLLVVDTSVTPWTVATVHPQP